MALTSKRTDRQMQRMKDELRDGRVHTKTLLLALEEQLTNLARHLPLACSGQAGVDAACTIASAANIIGAHALEHTGDKTTRALTDTECQQLLQHPGYTELKE